MNLYLRASITSERLLFAAAGVAFGVSLRLKMRLSLSPVFGFWSGEARCQATAQSPRAAPDDAFHALWCRVASQNGSSKRRRADLLVRPIAPRKVPPPTDTTGYLQCAARQ